jgi:hypothetical protein
MHTDTRLSAGVHNTIGCIHSQVVPQKTKVHFKGTPFLLFYVCSDPSYLDVEFTSTTFHSKHHKQLSTPVPSQFDCGYCTNPVHVTAQLLCALLLCDAKCSDSWLRQSSAFIKSHSIMLMWNKLLGMTNTASSTRY